MAAKVSAQLMHNQSHDEEEGEELLHSLPKEKGWLSDDIYLFQEFWCYPTLIQPIRSFQKHFQAKDTDIVLASAPKAGTTWLKALTFAIVNRKRFMPSQDNHPLLSFNPHDLVPFFELKVYRNNLVQDLTTLSEPRIFATHIPFASLPDSIKKSKCKIIYICRNPFDNFTSSWHFFAKGRPTSLPPLPLEEAFQLYCNGVSSFGPFWSHMLGYWKESQSKEIPKVLFIKYEELKRDITFQLKRVAQFLDCPFTLEEESRGVIDSIIQLCSLGKMKELEVNKSGTSFDIKFENKDYFRKGEIGDWVNLLSPWMVEKLSKVIEEKLNGSGLSFFLCEENMPI